MRNAYRKAMQERIERGVAWLDSRTEEFWNDYAVWSEQDREALLDGRWLDLDLSRLDLRDGTYCVLGQVGGGFQLVRDFAGLNDYKASSLGFLLDEREYGRASDFYYGAHYSMLTELWIEKIVQLREERTRDHTRTD